MKVFLDNVILMILDKLGILKLEILKLMEVLYMRLVLFLEYEGYLVGIYVSKKYLVWDWNLIVLFFCNIVK